MDAVTQGLMNRIANEYVEAPHTPKHPSYPAFLRDTYTQFLALREKGWKFGNTGKEGYYPTSAEMFKDISRKRLVVYTGGQEMPQDHPLCGTAWSHPSVSHLNPKWFAYDGTGIAMSRNELFRAVHDILGHGLTSCPFETWEGEIEAYKNHAQVYSHEAQLALYGETVGQLAHFYSGRGFVKVQECKIIPIRF